MDLKIQKYGIHASEVDLSKILDIKLPDPAPDGRIRVMSRGGSDISGAIIANIINADLSAIDCFD